MKPINDYCEIIPKPWFLRLFKYLVPADFNAKNVTITFFTSVFFSHRRKMKNRCEKWYIFYYSLYYKLVFVIRQWFNIFSFKIVKQTKKTLCYALFFIVRLGKKKTEGKKVIVSFLELKSAGTRYLKSLKNQGLEETRFLNEKIKTKKYVCEILCRIWWPSFWYQNQVIRTKTGEKKGWC
jgi:hypothetical protein